jgi:hypothetical protein
MRLSYGMSSVLTQAEGGRLRLDNQAQAVTSDMLHDEHCGGQQRKLASSVRLMD